jgi:hypothetical protein
MNSQNERVRSHIPETEHVAAQQTRESAGSKAKYWARKVLLPVYKPTRSLVMPNLWRSFIAQPPVFELWYRTRAWRLLLTHGMQSLDGKTLEGSKSFLRKVASYNKSQIWEWHRTRTEKLMAVLRCVDELPRKPKILVIGPRNEAELLLLNLYGFPFEDMESVDIFSYSPLIKLQDMHELAFPDDSFDIVYSAWTLKYAYDVEKACREMVRVLKPGGVIATGFSHTELVTSATGAPLAGGLDELLALFKPYVDWIYWQEALPTARSHEITTIFRIKKPVALGEAE